MKNARGLAAALGTGLVVASLWASAAPNDRSTVAYVNRVYPEGSKVGDVLRLVRDGKEPVLPANFSDLRAGDRLFVKQGAAVIVLLGTAEIVAVAQGDGGPNQPDFVVPKPALPNPSPGLLAFIKALLRPDHSRTVATVTRGGEPCHNSFETSAPTPFNAPVLFAQRPMLAAGKRGLFVSWTGGRAPFGVELVDAKTNKTIANARVAAACSVRLPVVDLTEGRYRLIIADANGSTLTEDSLMVGGTPPAPPRELEDPSLSPDARRIFLATWLVSKDRGRWALEAVQPVADAACPSAASRQWLERWGDVPLCTTNP